MMKRTHWIVGLAATGGLVLALWAGVPSAAADEAAASTGAPDAEAPSSVEIPPLDGAKVYAWNCGSCHSERWPKERSDSEWNTIMTHMRVRANLTAGQAEATLRYLKENN